MLSLSGGLNTLEGIKPLGGIRPVFRAIRHGYCISPIKVDIRLVNEHIILK